MIKIWISKMQAIETFQSLQRFIRFSEKLRKAKIVFFPKIRQGISQNPKSML